MQRSILKISEDFGGDLLGLCCFRIRRYPGERLLLHPGEAGAGRKALEFCFGTGMCWEGGKQPLERLSVGCVVSPVLSQPVEM